MKKNYDILDITKFIMALLVICVHIKIFPSLPETSHLFTNAIGRLGVPFFFICSGFLFFKNQHATEFKSILKTIRRLLILFIGWTILYGIITFFSLYIHTEEQPFIRLLRFLFRHIFLNPYFHLWFLPALMIGLVMTWFFIKYNLKKLGFIVATVFFIFGVLGETYYNFIIQFDITEVILKKYYQFFTTTRNGLFFGFPFIYLATCKNLFSQKTNFLLSLFFFVLLLLEYYFVKENQLHKDYNTFLSLFPFSKFFFDAIVSLKINISQKTSMFFREYSLGLYLTHPLWLIIPYDIGGEYKYFIIILLSLSLIFFIKKYKIPILYHLLK